MLTHSKYFLTQEEAIKCGEDFKHWYSEGYDASYMAYFCEIYRSWVCSMRRYETSDMH